MIKVKQAPAPRRIVAAQRVKGDPVGDTVAARLAALDHLVVRAHVTRCRAEALAEAIDGETCGSAIDNPAAAPISLIATLIGIAAGLSAALDGCDAALEKAHAGLG